jgi:hypothetical protein
MEPMKPMLGADALTEALLATGFDHVQSARSERRFVFTDLDSYLSWVDAHAFGAFVRRLDPADVTGFRNQCDARLAAEEGPEGYVLVKHVDLTIAHRTS